MELEVLKALGDETRFAMYRELATSTTPLSAQDLADALGLHANTVRLHLERLREAGLVDVEAIHRGTVGRPQHLYSLAAGAPGLGFDPPAHALLAGLLAAMAEQMGADAEAATATGRAWGLEAGKRTPSRSCLDSLAAELARLGFEPAADEEIGPDGTARIDSCTARSGSWPRPTPSWCATCTGDCARAS
jgi:predicted ArsR family transcriptional regulator